MTKKKTGAEKFPRMNFRVDEFPGCCGIGVVNYFNEDTGSSFYDWSARKHVTKPPKVFKTKEERAEDAYKRLADQEHGYTTLTLCLISEYGEPTDAALDDMWDETERSDARKRAGTGQFPELEEILKREKWESLTFLNPNHGNTLTMYTKHFPEWVNQ